MKNNLFSAIKLTAILLLLLAVIYPISIWAIAQLSSNKGGGEIIIHNNKKYYTNIGQSFNEDKYFWSRPSAVDYNAAGSGGSNKGPSNEEYLAQVQARIDTFLVHNPEVQKSEIPVDLITASGSGLDPNISVQAAIVQLKRISRIRKISKDKIANIISENTEKPLLGIFGPEKINVLKLNLALDKI